MYQCSQCEGFIPLQISLCPHCEDMPSPQSDQSKRSFKLKRSVQWLIGASISMTLAACYGAPPPMPNSDCPETPEGTEQPCETPSPSASPATASETPKTN